MSIIDRDDECQAVGIVAVRVGELVTTSEGSPIFPKNAEHTTTKSASSSRKQKQHPARRKRMATKTALRGKHAAQEMSLPIVSDANHAVRLPGDTMCTAIPVDPSICTPVRSDSLDAPHQTEHGTCIPVRRINANAERYTINTNRNKWGSDRVDGSNAVA